MLRTCMLRACSARDTGVLLLRAGEVQVRSGDSGSRSSRSCPCTPEYTTCHAQVRQRPAGLTATATGVPPPPPLPWPRRAGAPR
jgi:hypothetical protein